MKTTYVLSLLVVSSALSQVTAATSNPSWLQRLTGSVRQLPSMYRNKIQEFERTGGMYPSEQPDTSRPYYSLEEERDALEDELNRSGATHLLSYTYPGEKLDLVKTALRQDDLQRSLMAQKNWDDQMTRARGHWEYLYAQPQLEGMVQRLRTEDLPKIYGRAAELLRYNQRPEPYRLSGRDWQREQLSMF